MFARLADIMDRPELASSPDYATARARCNRLEEVNAIVAQWVGGRDVADVAAACDKSEVPCSALYNIADIFNDPQYAARENLLHLDDPRAGHLVMPSSLPKLSATPATFHHAGPALGADNGDVYGDLLGLTEATLQELKKAGVI